jgi:hypothetical protein
VGIRKVQWFEPESIRNEASRQGKAVSQAVNQPTVASIMSMEYGILNIWHMVMCTNEMCRKGYLMVEFLI